MRQSLVVTLIILASVAGFLAYNTYLRPAVELRQKLEANLRSLQGEWFAVAQSRGKDDYSLLPENARLVIEGQQFRCYAGGKLVTRGVIELKVDPSHTLSADIVFHAEVVFTNGPDEAIYRINWATPGFFANPQMPFWVQDTAPGHDRPRAFGAVNAGPNETVSVQFSRTVDPKKGA